MKSKTLVAAILAVLLAGAGLAIGANATPAAPGERAYAEADAPADGAWGEQGERRGHRRAMAGHRGPMARRMMALRVAKDPQLSVIRDLRTIEGAYRHSGREKDVASIYTDVLKRTSDPVVRDFANHRLARIAMRAGDTKGAIERLNSSLEDDLKRLK